jgi:CHRD domain-containing protein
MLALGLVSFAFAATHNHGNGKGHDNGSVFTASLNGHNETPAVHTKGTGNLTLTINADNTMSFTLTYSGLNNPAAVAHVHFGQPNVAGGVVFYFCGGGTKPTPCPPGTTSPATVTGTVAASDILAPTGQGLNAGDIAGFIQEIRDGFAYANVHTSSSPAGEIRGQLSSHGHDHGDNDED